MSDNRLRAAIVGCGQIGQRRARTMTGARLVACCDIDRKKAVALSASVERCEVFSDWRAMLEQVECDIVVVATLHDRLAEITKAAVARGRHVLVEKPAARSRLELEPVIAEIDRADVRVRVGFNHRYHRALRKARELVDAGAIGELMFIRGLYGHGGRIGYDREWRADPQMSGGGELIDQGPHLIDLARWFLGDFAEIRGFADTFFWNMPVDDNGFMLLRTAERKTAFLHVSCTEWKNKFSFEIYGKLGKIDIGGLGGSYGVERIALYRMLPEMGPPETTIWEYPMADDSWHVEFAEFVEDIRLKREPAAGLRDAHAVLRVIEKIYEASANDHRS
ncbi:MAG TPA: Gfo/Idh/MocA family oxidoreductase [Xanthobacteraceae bacterium]|jgi:predicted dehydrogenase|nr:Gfo/Idh/MocA family oxidoreductase [Xanthobacteraceae bacterium]